MDSIFRPKKAAYDFSSFSLLYLSSSLRNCAFGFMIFGRSPRHFGQYHFPLGFVARATHEKWNHSMGQRSLSHSIISPYDIWSQRQYVGSSGSIASSSSRGGDSSRCCCWCCCCCCTWCCCVWRVLRFFFLPVLPPFLRSLLPLPLVPVAPDVVPAPLLPLVTVVSGGDNSSMLLLVSTPVVSCSVRERRARLDCRSPPPPPPVEFPKPWWWWWWWFSRFGSVFSWSLVKSATKHHHVLVKMITHNHQLLTNVTLPITYNHCTLTLQHIRDTVTYVLEEPDVSTSIVS